MEKSAAAGALPSRIQLRCRRSGDRCYGASCAVPSSLNSQLLRIRASVDLTFGAGLRLTGSGQIIGASSQNLTTIAVCAEFALCAA
jgi:hypothetical protein